MSASRVRILTMIMASVALTACNGAVSNAASDGGAGSDAHHACDPLAAPATTLVPNMGVGKAADGTIYVVDSVAGASSDQETMRVFVSMGGALVRQHVAGSGGSGGNQYVFDIVAPGAGVGADRYLQVQTQGAMVTSMALGASGKDLSGGVALTLIDASAVTSLPIVDLPGVPLYVSDVSDGTAIVLTAPDDDRSAARLFYGPPGAMVERTLVDWNQSGSGWPTWTFLVDAKTYVASISGPGCCTIVDGGVAPVTPGPGTLDTGSARIPFTVRWPTPTTLSELSFQCVDGS